jgi:hypothetical protein
MNRRARAFWLFLAFAAAVAGAGLAVLARGDSPGLGWGLLAIAGMVAALAFANLVRTPKPA